MKLSEIILIPSREESLDRYIYLFKDKKKHKTAFYALNKNLDYCLVKDSFNTEYYGLFQDEKIVALLVLEFDRINKPQIEYVSTDKNWRGKGLLRYLINVVLKNHEEIYSDTHQTKEAQRFWKMLMMLPQPEFKIYIHDTETGNRTSTSKYSGQYDLDIWNDSDNPILVIVRQQRFKTNESFQKYLEHQERRKHFGRDDFNLWYGEYTQGLGYENP